MSCHQLLLFPLCNEWSNKDVDVFLFSCPLKRADIFISFPNRMSSAKAFDSHRNKRCFQARRVNKRILWRKKAGFGADKYDVAVLAEECVEDILPRTTVWVKEQVRGC